MKQELDAETMIKKTYKYTLYTILMIGFVALMTTLMFVGVNARFNRLDASMIFINDGTLASVEDDLAVINDNLQITNDNLEILQINLMNSINTTCR